MKASIIDYKDDGEERVYRVNYDDGRWSMTGDRTHALDMAIDALEPHEYLHSYEVDDRRKRAGGLVQQKAKKKLNLDLGLRERKPTAGEKARALHRVVRAMHDGHCPSCGHLGSSESFVVDLHPGKGVDHKCPKCCFTVAKEEAEAALAMFRPYLRESVRVFEQWREGLSQDEEEVPPDLYSKMPIGLIATRLLEMVPQEHEALRSDIKKLQDSLTFLELPEYRGEYLSMLIKAFNLRVDPRDKSNQGPIWQDIRWLLEKAAGQ